MITGALTIAVLSGAVAAVATIGLSGSFWLGLLAYSAGGALCLILSALALGLPGHSTSPQSGRSLTTRYPLTASGHSQLDCE